MFVELSITIVDPVCFLDSESCFDVESILKSHLDFCNSNTPKEHVHALDISKLIAPEIFLFGAYLNEKLVDDYVDLNFEFDDLFDYYNVDLQYKDGCDCIKDDESYDDCQPCKCGNDIYYYDDKFMWNKIPMFPKNMKFQKYYDE